MEVVNNERWYEAQNYEKIHWRRVVQRLSIGGSIFDWYDWKVEYIIDTMEPYLNLSRAKILEIGSGPVGIVSFIEGAAKFAVDPLENFYRTHYSLIELRDKETRYLGGMGEALPFRNQLFDFIIVDNVIDHCQNPDLVLTEINRVLRPGGFLYLMVNVHTHLGYLVRLFMESLEIDRGHPFSFSVGKIKRFLGEKGFSILSEDIEDYRSAKKKNISSKKVRRIAKGLMGAAEFEYKTVCKKITG